MAHKSTLPNDTDLAITSTYLFLLYHTWLLHGDPSRKKNLPGMPDFEVAFAIVKGFLSTSYLRGNCIDSLMFTPSSGADLGFLERGVLHIIK